MKRELVGILAAIGFISITISLHGCAGVSKQSVRAQVGSPESAQVDQLSVPLDDSVPRYLLAVERVTIGNTDSMQLFGNTYSTKDRSSYSGKQASRTDSGSQTTSTGRSQDVALGSGVSPSQPAAPAVSAQTLELKAVADSGSLGSSSLDSGAPNRVLRQGESTATTNGTAISKGEHSGGGNRDVKGSFEGYRINMSFYTPSRQNQITAQLTSALAGVRNFQLIERSAVGNKRKKEANLKGPFILRAQITELDERVEETSSKYNLFTLYGRKKWVRKGVVGLDVTITDTRTGNIVAAFPANGTFISAEDESKQGLIFPIAEQSSFAKSAIDQAIRVALNTAASRAYEELRDRVR